MKWLAFSSVLLTVLAAHAQTTADSIGRAIEPPLQNPEVTAFQLRRYVAARVPKLVKPSTAERWTAESQRLRRKVLEVAFHGWPKDWIASAPKFEDLGEIPAGKGYRLRRLRYEIVPGFDSTALLYEPENIHEKIPAILNVNGHEPEGKAMEYIQKRCINQARQGILALNLEWIGMGELANPENAHWNEAYLDFAGSNGLGLFYLAMRRGLDYLWDNPKVDRRRIGITGLSGGGWQSLMLGALDERVLAALPDAGYLSNVSVGGVENVGDNEQSATDLGAAADYTQLTAMRAPRPTLLIFNETDNCCFRAPRMKPLLYDDIRPVFELLDAADRFLWYENIDPGDHNYQLDNRLHSYEFFAKYFGLPPVKHEIVADADIKSIQELAIGVPANNLTLLSLARKLAADTRHPPMPSSEADKTAWAKEERSKLDRVVRYHPVNLDFAWPIANTYGGGLKTVGYRFDFSNGLSADGELLKAITIPDNAPWTLVLNDAGRRASRALISDRVNRGDQVLAADLLFTGDAAPPKFYYPLYDRMLATVGDRSMGIEVSQLIRIAWWLQQRSGNRRGRLETTGIRSQAVARVAEALQPQLFSDVVVHEGLRSWSEVFKRPVRYQDAPELFCLDLYKEFDLDRLAEIAAIPGM